MKRMLVPLVVGLFWLTSAHVSPAVEEDVQANGDVPAKDAAIITGPVTFPRVDYEARVSEGEARIVARVLVEASKAGTQGLFEGELALLPAKLPAHLQIERAGNRFGLVVDKRGRYEFTVEMMAKVKDLEPWKEISFAGPPAAIGSLMASANGANVELQLLSGTTTATERANGGIRVKGVLGVERKVSIRWSGNGVAEGSARKPVVTTETAVRAEITPAVIKYATRFKCDVLQGSVSKLQLSLPASHTLTRLAGSDIRDWEIKAPNGNPANSGGQLLEVQFLKPQGSAFELSIYSEQSVEATPFTVQLSAPQPLGVEREAGLFTITAEDISAEVSAVDELRQVNAPAGALACYRFNTRPFALSLNLRRVEPLVTVDERLASTLEEARLVTHYSLGLQVEKAAVYGLDLLMPAGCVVGAVQGDDILDWKLSDTDRKLRVNFTKRVSGARRIDVVLEQALKDFPEKIVLEPLRVAGASKETAEISARAVPGIRIKTAELAGVREVPTRTLQPEAKEAAPEDSLGFKSEQPDWKVTLTADRLSPRIVSEIFNLVTIGDGILGGSATIRYGLLNQGVQEFEIIAPASWKNLEFTGPNIRRKEQKPDGTWVVGLQDKVWGGYTLVVTYDFQFDPKGATLSIGGIHTKGVERETGSAVITTASGLKLVPRTVSEALRRIDELELSAANRALITRSVSLAYQYEASPYQLDVQVQPFEEVSVLSAVADRTQVTSVLTAAGEMLTQASFMVKNNDKQFQRFKLPKGATFWSCHVNGEPAKAERDGDWVLAPLPRGANRNQAFAVDIVYAETKGVSPTVWPQSLALSAPQTDVPNTYAEWQLYFPSAYRLSSLGGNMVPVRGTTYDLQDAWQKFIRFYWEFLHESGPGLLLALSLGGLVIALVGAARRHGGSGVMSVLVVFAIMVILAGMLLPALSRAKARAQRISGLNNLKQIGLAARTFALDNTNRLPNSFEEMMNELSTDKITYDPETGQRYTYVGAGYDIERILPDSVIAYSPPNTRNYRDVALADGSVQQMSARQFEELERRGLIRMATPQQVAQNQQVAAVRGAQALAAPEPAEAPGAPRPAQTGAVAPRMRSIRIDIPREGQTFTFTKVLHLDGKPLLVEAQMMSLKAFQTVQMCLQSGAFVAGLAMIWRQWRSRRNSLVLAIGLALCIGAVGDLLLSWRLLHLALIWLTPLLCLGLIGYVTWKLWPRSANAPAGHHLSPGLPPAVASLAVLGLTLFNAEAASEDVRPSGSPASIVDSVSIRSARYTVKVVDQVATVEVALAATTREANQKLFLFGDDVAVQRFECKPGQAKLVREAKGVAMIVPHPGNATAQLTLVLKLRGDVTKRQLDFAVPSSLSSEWSISLDQPDADVEFPAATWVKHSTSGQETQVEAIMGSGERAQLFWTPKVKRAAETTANVISHTTTLLTFGNGVLNERATIDYQVTQGELRQLRIGLPSGQRLLRVEGEGIRTWDLNAGGHEQTIELELLKGVSSNYRLTVETEKPLGSLPATVTAETARPIGVSRETGLLGIRSDDDLELVVQRSSELYRVETEAFDRQAGPKVERIMNAFRFLRPDFKLEVRVAAMQPEIQTSTHNRFRIGQEQVGLSTTMDYLIKRAGVFRLKASLPDGYRLDSVTGTNILQTTERQEANGQRVLEVTLKEKTTGAYSMRLELTQTVKEVPGTLSLAGAHPLEVQKLDGFVLVSAEPGVAVKPASFEGLIEIPATAAGAGDNSSVGGSLAYKFIAGTPQAQAAWKLALQTEKVGSWVRAEFVTTLALSETMITGRALGRFDVQKRPSKNCA